MKNLFIIGLLYCTLASCQNTNESFHSILNKTKEFELPINVVEVIGEVRKEARNKALTKEECIVIGCLDSIWSYNNYYRYSILCRFGVNDNVVALIFERSYFPESILEEKSEYVLGTYTIKGKLIDMLPINGAYGDDVSFTSTIGKDLFVKMTKETFGLAPKTKQSIIKTSNTEYKITDKGKIEEK